MIPKTMTAVVPESKNNSIHLKNDSLEPTTGMDMPWSGASGAALDAGESSTKSFLGGLTLQEKVNTGIRMTTGLILIKQSLQIRSKRSQKPFSLCFYIASLLLLKFKLF